MWIMDPDGAYVFPMEDGVKLVLAAPHQAAATRVQGRPQRVPTRTT